MIFRRNGARKRDSREHHRFSDAPPGGTNEPPEKCARAPGTPKKLRTLVKAPGTLRAAPRGALGAPRGTFAGHVTLSFLHLVLHGSAKS